VAKQVGTEGKLGAQARCPGGGVWKTDDNVNVLAGNLTDQVRTSPRSPPRWPTGTCRRRISVVARARSWRSRTTINTMVDQLRSFASEVTRVAREVGTEGRWAAGRRARRQRGLEGLTTT